MTDGAKFNPFVAAAERPPLRAKLVNDFADFLIDKAAKLLRDKAENSEVFQSEANKEWLMDEIDELIEKDDWDADDVARLSSLFFFLLTSSEIR